MLLQVHDELVFEVPPEELERMRELVRSHMEGVVELGCRWSWTSAWGRTGWTRSTKRET